MTKKELVKAVAEKAGIKERIARAAVNGLIEVITEALKKEEPVGIRGFGTFLMKERRPRIGVNLRTGEKIKIPAKLVPVFRPGKDLKEATERVIKG